MKCFPRRCTRECNTPAPNPYRAFYGICILTLASVVLLCLRFGVDNPWELLAIIISIICIAIFLNAVPTESNAVIYIVLLFCYFIISISNDYGADIQIFITTLILVLLIYLLITGSCSSRVAPILIVAIVIACVFLYRLVV